MDAGNMKEYFSHEGIVSVDIISSFHASKFRLGGHCNLKTIKTKSTFEGYWTKVTVGLYEEMKYRSE